LFTDIVDSTMTASSVGDRRWLSLLDAHHAAARHDVEAHRGRLIKSTGDGILATFDGPGRAIRCAAAVRDAAAKLGIEIRAGVHIGEIELLADDIAGISVHIAARVTALAGPAEILVTRTVKDLVVGSGISFADRGTHSLKGIPDEWPLFAATDV
jgi:class 3 adenylate cyclase